jgi:hypothetical protein
MTLEQYKREKRRKMHEARERELRLLATARETADPRYAAEAAGYWLKLWAGAPKPKRNFRMRTLSCDPWLIPARAVASIHADYF